MALSKKDKQDIAEIAGAVVMAALNSEPKEEDSEGDEEPSNGATSLKGLGKPPKGGRTKRQKAPKEYNEPLTAMLRVWHPVKAISKTHQLLVFFGASGRFTKQIDPKDTQALEIVETCRGEALLVGRDAPKYSGLRRAQNAPVACWEKAEPFKSTAVYDGTYEEFIAEYGEPNG